MKTSNYANAELFRIPNCVSVSFSPGRNFSGPAYPALAPSISLLSRYKHGLSWADYVKEYNRQLSALDAQQVYGELCELTDSEDPVLLCFESAKTLDSKPCHRRLVAAWFEKELGIEVPEWNKRLHVARMSKPAASPKEPLLKVGKTVSTLVLCVSLLGCDKAPQPDLSSMSKTGVTMADEAKEQGSNFGVPTQSVEKSQKLDPPRLTVEESKRKSAQTRSRAIVRNSD